MWNIELIVNWWRVINDAQSSNWTTYSSEKINAIISQMSKVVSWIDGEILIKDKDWNIVNSWLTLNELALALHNHDADDIVLSNVNFWWFLNLWITNLQELADYIDDYFTELQEQWTEYRNIVPDGSINWINTVFTISWTPLRLSLYLNWIRQKEWYDYNMSSNVIIFILPPSPWDVIIVDYNI